MRWLLLLALLVLLWRLLRSRIAELRRIDPAAGRPRPAADTAAFDPHAVLGVPRNATREEIAQAYRTRIKEYHPDRVATLGPELQELAHRKTLEIQRAWELLRR